MIICCVCGDSMLVSNETGLKMHRKLYVLLVVTVFKFTTASIADNEVHTTKYEPTWPSLDSRPLPQWYDDAKFGIFIHWGVFSVPSFGSEWFWHSWKSGDQRYIDFINNNYPPGFSYQQFGNDFTAEFFNPNDWADLFAKSGAKYIVLTSKHHEGFTLWPSKTAFSWNAAEVGPHRDLLGDLANAVRNRTSIRFGVYHSLYEWYNPLYMADSASQFTTKDFVNTKTMPELYELVNTYKPDVIWSDGDWEAPDTYWDSRNFLAWLYNESPVKDTVVSNDRWGNEISCHHGDFYTCADRYSPGVLQPHKWENCLTIDKQSWGFRREAKLEDFLTYDELILELVKTVSCGGNLLLNVGPTKEGTITPIFEERLLQIGSWLDVNGASIYGSRPWTFQNDTLTENVWYTLGTDGGVYGAVLDWPQNNKVTLGSPQLTMDSTVTILGYSEKLNFTVDNNSITIQLPGETVQPRRWYVLRFQGVIN